MNKIKVFLEMIKFEHSIFALPFAYMGAILASIALNDSLPSWPTIGWITLAMVGARSAAMGLNRLIDAAIDAENPRTALRAIPAGLLSKKEVLIFIVISFVLLFYAASQLNPLCVWMLPVAVFFLTFYSYTKRFTWLCHVVLGLTIGLGPLGGWIAVTGAFDLTGLVLYATVAFWTAGFDILYACQDTQFDREKGLHSIPSRFGVARALLIARSFHVVTAVGLVAVWWMADLNWIYLIGLAIAYVVLFYEHALVKPNDLSRINTAFMTMNGILSMVMFTFTLIDVAVL
ncbi:4-hydroxybenzoate octaprenyltransferase [Paenibacillus antri]|uniref:4-hydroxybenzoate polyprenyltransferase n=1 Tax=Paenibacillus antri TaxID=2582848 RepID=A0A5R9GJL7_9BACL|nr:UbiA-like polyprenyltransferase [Paenibacillus antri]TLS53093.1 4-hydroxybenzoate octaprenyltransferase [Paenibacillus antri]